MDFEEANSQVDSLCGALPRDDLRMHKCIKSDISKVMYRWNVWTLCMLVLLLTFQTLIRLAKCWLSSKSKLFDILMVLDGTLSLDWHQSWKQIDTPEKIRVSFIFSWR